LRLTPHSSGPIRRTQFAGSCLHAQQDKVAAGTAEDDLEVQKARERKRSSEARLWRRGLLNLYLSRFLPTTTAVPMQPTKPRAAIQGARMANAFTVVTTPPTAGGHVGSVVNVPEPVGVMLTVP